MPPAPEPSSATPSKDRELRDVLAALALFLATSAFVLWQNTQIAILWDLGYLLDTSFRISLGQVPYRDFPLVHPPLTFAIQAALIHLAGRHYFVQIGYAALVGGLSSVVTWRILLRVLRKTPSAWTTSLLLAVPLIFLGVQSIYPHPIYDTDCAFAFLVAISSLQRIEARNPASGFLQRWMRPAAAGVALVLPVFFKQNMGAPFLLIAVSGILLLLATGPFYRTIHPPSPAPSTLLRLLASIAAAFAAAMLLIHLCFGWGNYLRWTVHFAAQRRLPGIADMVEIYRQPSFLWTIPTFGLGLVLLHTRLASHFWIRLSAIALCAAPFLGSLVYLFLSDDLDERADNLLALWPLLLLASAVLALVELRRGITLPRLLPFFVLAAIHGTFLSQQLWGSTYAIWPLLLILVAQILAAFPPVSRPASQVLAGVVSATFLLCGGLYTIGHERMNYLQIPGSPIVRTQLAPLRGLSTPGPYLPDFEELVHYAEQEIPTQDGLLLLPDEEPFFFATGRTPQFPLLLMDHSTDPYSAKELWAVTRKCNIRWVIIKTRLQLNEDPLPDREETLRLMAQEFLLSRKLKGYEVFRRR